MSKLNPEHESVTPSAANVAADTDSAMSRMDRISLFTRSALLAAGVLLSPLPVKDVALNVAAAAQPNQPSLSAAFESPDPDPPSAPVVPTAPTTTEPEPEPYYSIPQIGIATFNDEIDGPRPLFSDMQAIGLTAARLTLPREDYTHYLSVLRSEMLDAKAHDVEIIVNLGQGKDTPRAGFPSWAAQMAAQLPGVDRFVIQNEVNSPLFSDDTVVQNVDLLYKTYKAIKEVRPDAIVSGFGLASGYNPVPFLRAAAKYADKKYGGLQNIMDTLSIHTYLRPDASAELIAAIEEIWPGEINIDESGYIVDNSGQAYESDGFVTKQEQAKLYVQLIQLFATDPQIQCVLNYRMQDTKNDPLDLRTGFITANGGIRPIYRKVGSLLLPVQQTAEKSKSNLIFR